MRGSDPEKHFDEKGNFLDKPNHIGTWTRRRVDPLHLSVDDIDIEDIAHSLSRICRYNGHCAGHLSVARHSIWVMEHVDALTYAPAGKVPRFVANTGTRSGLLLNALLHDASEAYLGDVPRPLKRTDEYWFYREAEDKVEDALAKKFGLTQPRPHVIGVADSEVLTKYELPRLRWTWYGSAETDKAEFLYHFDRLVEGRRAEYEERKNDEADR